MFSVGPQSKRPRVNGFSRLPDMDADDITPPPSPTIADKIVNLRSRGHHIQADDFDQLEDGKFTTEEDKKLCCSIFKQIIIFEFNLFLNLSSPV